MKKLVGSIKEAIKLCNLKDGDTISFHHHLRNGDYVLNMVMATIAEMGYKDIKLAASSIFPIHEPLIKHIQEGVVTSIDTNYMSGVVGEAISEGIMDEPVTFRSHGGRPRAIESGELEIDVAFIAAPTADYYGNINGVDGPSACGSLGYAFPDARHGKKVVAITDNLMDYPISPISIDQTQVDYVVEVDAIGEASGIVSGTTQITRDPIGLTIAKYAARVIEHSGLLKDGFSFQTGAGGSSLAAAYYLKQIMIEKNIVGSFGMGGITKYFVDFLEEGLFKKLIDVQCFDLDAVRSIKSNPDHLEVSASFYANPNSKGCAVDNLDIVILGATEIDTSFNVNVHTNSNGFIIGGSGGHNDTAAGSKLSIIVTPLIRARLPIIVDEVLTTTTPGNDIDVIVTERGIAVNPRNKDLRERLMEAGLPIVDIQDLKKKAESMTGKPNKIKTGDKVVGLVEYRDGNIIDSIYNIV
ncbi:citrate lyase subunit alpha [Clostridium sp. Cult3]|uniref:citrate lyase subunit alpha n=1 Tax=Clostridium sp. Cult3 TaxID=2079004 RepID=UPI001F02AEFF|nr:citrate lyase subunit alpha [Clostridium sp. Cult3]MCF6459939.1 citrate lyase subunit alpha [Clostridium sp. Cult3]